MRTLLFLVTWLASTTAWAQARVEKLQYDITWGYNDVASMSLQLGCPRSSYVPAALTARSLGAAEQIHPFRVRFDSFLGSSGAPFEGRTYIFEDGTARSFQTRFLQRDGKARVQKKLGESTSTLRLSLARSPTHDMLSWLEALRKSELRAGRQHSFYIWDGWKLFELRATVEKAERVWTPLGTYEAWRIAIARTRLHHSSDEAYQPKQAPRVLGSLWLSTSAGHLPVAMDFVAPVGKAKIRLTRASVAACEE